MIMKGPKPLGLQRPWWQHPAAYSLTSPLRVVVRALDRVILRPRLAGAKRVAERLFGGPVEFEEQTAGGASWVYYILKSLGYLG